LYSILVKVAKASKKGGSNCCEYQKISWDSAAVRFLSCCNYRMWWTLRC